MNASPRRTQLADAADRVHAERQDRRRRAPTRPILETAERRRRRDPAPVLHGRAAARRQLPRLHGRDQGRARARAVLLPLSHAGHGGHHRQRARASQPEDGARAAALGHAGDGVHARLRSSTVWAEQAEASASRASRRASSRRGPVAPGDRGEPRRLHPVHALRARLPRGAGQRRHRLRLPRRALEDRVRPRRPDGRLHLRRLRRVRAGLPDRRADAGARGRRWPCPTSRWTRCARTAASAASSPTTSRTTRSSTCRAATARPTTAACA